jgi:hypothetical protein
MTSSTQKTPGKTKALVSVRHFLSCDGSRQRRSNGMLFELCEGPKRRSFDQRQHKPFPSSFIKKILTKNHILMMS